jgi:hypothetical protein
LFDLHFADSRMEYMHGSVKPFLQIHVGRDESDGPSRRQPLLARLVERDGVVAVDAADGALPARGTSDRRIPIGDCPKAARREL